MLPVRSDVSSGTEMLPPVGHVDAPHASAPELAADLAAERPTRPSIRRPSLVCLPYPPCRPLFAEQNLHPLVSHLSTNRPSSSRCRLFPPNSSLPADPAGARRRLIRPNESGFLFAKTPVCCSVRNNMQNIFGVKKETIDIFADRRTDVVCQTEQTEQAEQTKRNVGQNKQGETRTHNPIRLQQ